MIVTGSVTLVGAGPGDPELLTIKAVKAIRRATVLLVDDLVDDAVLRYARRSARIVHVGKRGGCPSTPQAFIHKLMVAEARRGERVVRLKGGDPFVFGRGGEECDALRAAGIDVQVISGLTAGIAGPAAIGLPVTDRRHAQGVALVTGHRARGWRGARLACAGAQRPDLGDLHGHRTLRSDPARAARYRMAADTPAAAISNACTAQQRHALCRLDELADTVRREDLASPAVLVVGDVVRSVSRPTALMPLLQVASAA